MHTTFLQLALSYPTRLSTGEPIPGPSGRPLARLLTADDGEGPAVARVLNDLTAGR